MRRLKMSAKTKVVVLHMKELIYTLIFAGLGILLIFLLLFMFLPGKEDGESVETMRYVAGVYTSSIQFGEHAVDMQVIVDENRIQSVSMVNLDETVETMYPLMEPALENIADQVVEKMDLGYQSDVGEGGDRLSTGEKQLISFARAVLADPRIFVLDEATSSIDTQTEQLIQKATDKILKGRTSFLIAHRLSTIRNADLILVVKDGKIIEQGKHLELLEQKGYYYQLVRRQFTEEESQKILD